MNENKNIDFETEFKEYKKQETKNNLRDKLKEKRIWYYVLILCLYVFLQFLVGFVIVFAVTTYGKIRKDKYVITGLSQIVNDVYNNPHQIGIVDSDPFITHSERFKQNFFTVETLDISADKKIWIVISKENKHSDKLLVKTEQKNIYKMNDDWKNIVINHDIKLLSNINNIRSILTEFSLYIKLAIITDLKYDSSNTASDLQTLNEYFFGGTTNFIVVLIITIVISGMLWKDFAYDFKYKLSKNVFKSILFIIGGVVLMITASYFSDIITSLIVKLAKIDFINSANQKTIELLLENKSQAIYIKLTAVLLAPIIEELIFRKTIFKLIKSKGMAIYVSSLAFGLVHVLTMIKTPEMMLLNLIPYFMGGLVLSSIYTLNRKNIYIPIFAHMIFNLIGVLV